MVDAIIDNELEVANAAVDALPQTRMFRRAKQHKDDPTQTLIANLGLSVDEEQPSPVLWGAIGEEPDDLTLETAINKLAKEAKVTPQIAAAAMAEIFERDPTGTNTVNRRFDPEEAKTFIETHMNADALAKDQGQVLSNLNREQDFAKDRKKLKEYKISYKKMPAGPNKTRLGTEISILEGTLRGGNTLGEGERALEKYIGPEGNGLADILSRTEPGSPAYKAGVKLLENEIKNDDALSSQDKDLLLNTIKR